jgi:hypothetical protein
LEVKPANPMEPRPMSDPLSLLDRLQSIADRVPSDDPVAIYLASRGYPPLSVAQTLWSLERGCAVAELWWVREEHARGLEALLAEPEECHDGCERCRDESAFRQSLLTPARVRAVVDAGGADGGF